MIIKRCNYYTPTRTNVVKSHQLDGFSRQGDNLFDKDIGIYDK